MSEKSARDLLLDHVVDHFVTDGLGDLSLRKIAAAVGTSHRMLLYHFGSKNGLLLEVVRAVEARTRSQLEEFGQLGGIREGSGLGTDQVIRAMWQFVADPAQGGFERLFFALYGRALQGDAQVRPLLGESIESWLEANDALAGSARHPAPPGPRPRPPGPGRGAGVVARPLGYGRPGRGRCLARGLRPPLRGLVVGGRALPDGPADRTSRTAPSAPAPRNGPGGRARPRRPPWSPDRSGGIRPRWQWRETRTPLPRRR